VGVKSIVVLFVVTALVSIIWAVLITTERVPLSWGRFLLGGDFEQLGAAPFLINATLLLVLALGLWMRQRWARLITILVAVIPIFLAIPGISSAVTDGRYSAIGREGLNIIVRMVIFFYLSQEPVKEWFAKR
jgi:hypothetical protein